MHNNLCTLHLWVLMVSLTLTFPLQQTPTTHIPIVIHWTPPTCAHSQEKINSSLRKCKRWILVRGSLNEYKQENPCSLILVVIQGEGLAVIFPITFHPSVDSVKQPKSPDRGGKEKLERALQYIRRQKYDVFLSFAQEDEEFAEEVRQRLMTQANLRVFVPSEGQSAKSCY